MKEIFEEVIAELLKTNPSLAKRFRDEINDCTYKMNILDIFYRHTDVNMIVYSYDMPIVTSIVRRKDMLDWGEVKTYLVNEMLRRQKDGVSK